MITVASSSIKVKDLGKCVTGKTPASSNSAYYGGKIPFIRIPDFGDGRFIGTGEKTLTEEGLEAVRKAALPKGSLMVSCIATIGRVGITKEPISVTNQQINSIIPNGEIVSTEWLYYFFKDMGDDLAVFGGGGSVFEIISKSKFENIEIELPDRSTQEAIAEVLSSLDDKIDLLKRQNKTLEGMAEALFRQWFIEEAQDDWEEVELRDVFEEIESGRRPKGGVGNYTDGIPSIGAESVKRIGIHDFGKEKFVPVDFFESMNRGVVKHGDILVYKDGGVPGEFKPHFTMVGFGFPHEKMCINEHVFRCKPKTESLRAYSFCYLNSERCRFELEERGTGAAIPGLNSTEFSTCPIPLPDSEKLILFERIAGGWLDRILKNAVESRTLGKLRDTLLPKLMSGEVRVNLD